MGTEMCEGSAGALAEACEICSGEQVRRGGRDLPSHRPTLRLPASPPENPPAPVPGRDEDLLYCLEIRKAFQEEALETCAVWRR